MRDALKKISLLKYAVIIGRIFSYTPNPLKRIVSLVGFFRDYARFSRMKANGHFTLFIQDLYPRIYDKTGETHIDPVYFYQDAWCAEKIFRQKPNRHYDLASSVPAMGMISQFVPVTMVDIRPPDISLPNLSFVKSDMRTLPFADNSIQSLSSICVLEHIGLGRYGDELDPYGSEKVAAEIKRVLAYGGNLYISVPVDDKNKVYFNAHRAFTRDYILELLAPLELVEERYIYGNRVERAFAPKKGFGTGLYHFKKAATAKAELSQHEELILAPDFSSIRVPLRALKFILFQRTHYLFWRRSKFVQALTRILPKRVGFALETLFTKFNVIVSAEALIFQKTIRRLFSKEMRDEYDAMKHYLPAHARVILDIGAGVGGIDILLVKHYAHIKPTIHLLDRTEMPNKVYYGLQDQGCYYNSMPIARDMLIANRIDTEQIVLQEENGTYRINSPQQFDLIISLISWGFHYPISVYLDQVYDKLADNGVLILDVRKQYGGIEQLQKKFGKAEIIFDANKHVRAVCRKQSFMV